ncbi:sigma-54-dependent Fis family transcriptional regulator, partial [Sphingobacteriaceae bacterium AH-315-L07]|nr:sigma-54-dependent Fis family transcriptional regulator [Sphingobacteriaceae bacterium AH-315-L07]
LRVLETKKIVRVGSNNEVAVDVRVIAATNKNLADEVKAGNFRKDLFYRLQGFIIDLPPLRERGDDILLLANEFLKACAKDNELGDLRFEKATTKLLLNHSWHGNVRELKTTVERSAWLAQDNLIKADDILFTEDVGF